MEWITWMHRKRLMSMLVRSRMSMYTIANDTGIFSNDSRVSWHRHQEKTVSETYVPKIWTETVSLSWPKTRVSFRSKREHEHKKKISIINPTKWGKCGSMARVHLALFARLPLAPSWNICSYPNVLTRNMLIAHTHTNTRMCIFIQAETSLRFRRAIGKLFGHRHRCSIHLPTAAIFILCVFLAFAHWRGSADRVSNVATVHYYPFALQPSNEKIGCLLLNVWLHHGFPFLLHKIPNLKCFPYVYVNLM